MTSRAAMPADAPIGDHIRRLRAERGMTQESLAEAASVSTDLIKKLEQGKRKSARLSTLMQIADALDVSIAEMTGKRPRLDGVGDRLVLGLRDAVLDPGYLPGIDTADDDGAPTPLPELERALGAAWADYWSGRFVDLARTMPQLLAEARVTARSRPVETAGVLAQAHQLAACLLVHLGRDDLAAIGAERAIAAAAGGTDELQAATLLGTYSWTMLHQGRPAEAARLAGDQAERIEPRMSRATPQQITVWGGLAITAMAAAAAAGDSGTVGDLATLAAAGAARIGTDRRDYEVSFGPGQLAVQITHARTVLGQPDRALAAAATVMPAMLRPVEYGRHLIDVAGAHAASTRGGDRAVMTLQRARDLGGAVWLRHQGPARAIIADLAERQARMSPALRDLVQTLDGR